MVFEGNKTAADAARLFKVHPATVSRLLTRHTLDVTFRIIWRRIVNFIWRKGPIRKGLRKRSGCATSPRP